MSSETIKLAHHLEKTENNQRRLSSNIATSIDETDEMGSLDYRASLSLFLFLLLVPAPATSVSSRSGTGFPRFRRSQLRGSSYGENNFGDIMGGCETHVTVEGICLSPMERVVLTANGNLQRIMSAHYDAPVYVHVIKCDRLNATTFDRSVDLVVADRTFCTAIGTIELYSEDCTKAIEERNVGVGQLFRYLGVLPSFTLLQAGRKADGCLWRQYELSCPQLRCRFVETFAPSFLEFMEIKTLSQTVTAVTQQPATSFKVFNER